MDEQLANLFQALAHPTRIGIIKLLAQSDMCVCELVAALKQPQGHVSRHLMVLRGANLVKPARRGNKVYYSLAHPSVKQLIEVAEGLLDK